jgi:hypothetical protein
MAKTPTTEDDAAKAAAEAAAKAAEEAARPVLKQLIRHKGRVYQIGRKLPAGLSAAQLARLTELGAI